MAALATQAETPNASGVHPYRSIALAVALVVALACGATSPNTPDQWTSDAASLNITDATSTLLILASGDCFGSYGEFTGAIPTGQFALSGTFTQLGGAYPGKITYPAQFAGSKRATTISITVAVPDLHTSFGPFTLTPGTLPAWPQCLYP